MYEDNECPTGKKIYDKKGATTLKNKTMELHHIEMRIYPCPRCNGWHLTSVGKHKPFRHCKLDK
jgi:hypothetical protein